MSSCSTSWNRLQKQIEFFIEIDKLKSIRRRTYLTDGSRYENSVEHSWHLALSAMIFAEHAAETIDTARVVEMVLVHDIIEIDAGDTFAYDEVGAQDKEIREQAAADRLFAMLPADQAERFRGLWDEFEAGQTPESRFAETLDRFQPMLHNIITHGKSWREHGIRKHQVIEKNNHMSEGSPTLWEHIRKEIENMARVGYLAE